LIFNSTFNAFASGHNWLAISCCRWKIITGNLIRVPLGLTMLYVDSSVYGFAVFD